MREPLDYGMLIVDGVDEESNKIPPLPIGSKTPSNDLPSKQNSPPYIKKRSAPTTNPPHHQSRIVLSTSRSSQSSLEKGVRPSAMHGQPWQPQICWKRVV